MGVSSIFGSNFELPLFLGKRGREREREGGGERKRDSKGGDMGTVRRKID
jgi:hypothetical protein